MNASNVSETVLGTKGKGDVDPDSRSTHELAKNWDVGVELESGGLMLAMTSDSPTDLGQATWPFWACFLVCKVRVHTRPTSSSL